MVVAYLLEDHFRPSIGPNKLFHVLGNCVHFDIGLRDRPLHLGTRSAADGLHLAVAGTRGARPDLRRRKAALGRSADFDGSRSLGTLHRATELICKLDSRPAIGKAPAHVVVAIFVMSGPPMLRPNIVPSMKIVYSVQCFAEATERHDNFYDMRKIPLD